MERIIFHIDVNNAFLSWTAIALLKKGFKKDIRNSVAIIGGSEKDRRGIVLAKSTEAKKYGIVTAETIMSARRKYHNLEIYPPDYKVYQDSSDSLFGLLSKYTDDIEIASIDECYLDYGKVKNLYGDELAFAYKLKEQVKNELGFTINIGIANNKLCAKMASDFSKPDKVHTLYAHEIEEKLEPLKVGELFGIGKKTALKLEALGIYTIGELANYDQVRLSKHFKNMATKMINSAKGIDDSPVNKEESKLVSIGHEFTLADDVDNKNELHKYLFELAEMVGKRLRKQKKYAYVICVVLKDNFFKRKSHQRKLKNSTNITSEIYKIAVEVFNELWRGEQIRLIGIRLDSLSEHATYQSSLFEDITARDKEEKLDVIVDSINKKFGTSVVKKASLANTAERKRLKN